MLNSQQLTIVRQQPEIQINKPLMKYNFKAPHKWI